MNRNVLFKESHELINLDLVIKVESKTINELLLMHYQLTIAICYTAVFL